MTNKSEISMSSGSYLVLVGWQIENLVNHPIPLNHSVQSKAKAHSCIILLKGSVEHYKGSELLCLPQPYLYQGRQKATRLKWTDHVTRQFGTDHFNNNVQASSLCSCIVTSQLVQLQSESHHLPLSQLHFCRLSDMRCISPLPAFCKLYPSCCVRKKQKIETVVLKPALQKSGIRFNRFT